VEKERAVSSAIIASRGENPYDLPRDRTDVGTPAAKTRRESMIWVPGGHFLMGSSQFYREERPARPAYVEGFWIDPHPITNGDFAEFVRATGYMTLAERAPDPDLYTDADPALLIAGSLVFRKPAGPVPLRNNNIWWAYVPGANWRHPEGPGSLIDERLDHPVVHIAYEDAVTYAAWALKALPTEEEWEFAARGGLEGAIYPWGNDPNPDGRIMANTWQGRFPWENLREDGYETTSPVGTFSPNGYGLHDMVGNTWEWTASPFVSPPGAETCCHSSDASAKIARHVVKGGSHLCSPNYCLRYRPAARQGETIDTSTSHIGFRCIVRDPGGPLRPG
jgi:formylglycine-generating enzyme